MATKAGTRESKLSVGRRAMTRWAHRKVAAAAAAATPLEELMTTPVTCVTADRTIESLGGILLERGFSGVPVIDENERLIGVVSQTDLMRERFSADGTPEASSEWPTESFYTERLAGLRVADVMMPGAFTLRATDSLARAAALMATEGVHRIVTVDASGRVAGIVSSLDLARWIGKP
jgi:CBS domain-containing protein